MGRTIEVVDQTPEWAAFFEKEAAHLAVIFGPHLTAIHHIGSTAIPGIKAKPIITKYDRTGPCLATCRRGDL